jgi:hypothetical protein
VAHTDCSGEANRISGEIKTKQDHRAFPFSFEGSVTAAVLTTTVPANNF